jgi:hypothetical protein
MLISRGRQEALEHLVNDLASKYPSLPGVHGPERGRVGEVAPARDRAFFKKCLEKAGPRRGGVRPAPRRGRRRRVGRRGSIQEAGRTLGIVPLAWDIRGSDDIARALSATSPRRSVP